MKCSLSAYLCIYLCMKDTMNPSLQLKTLGKTGHINSNEETECKCGCIPICIKAFYMD